MDSPAPPSNDRDPQQSWRSAPGTSAISAGNPASSEGQGPHASLFASWRGQAWNTVSIGRWLRTFFGRAFFTLLALGLIVGGIVGNLFDRLGLPGLTWHAPLGREGNPVLAVRDWIHFTLPGVIDWPIFNLADSWLVIGAAMLLIMSFFESASGAASGDVADEPKRP